VAPEELTCAWLDGFIPLPKADEIIKGALGENHREYGYNARFWYPKAGSIHAVIEALTGNIRNLHVNAEITEIDIVKKQVQLHSGRREAYDSLISTVPLPQLFSMIKPQQKQLRASVKRLRWNSIFNLNLGVIKKDTARRHWVYFPEKDFCFFRVGFFHNFSSYAAPFEMSSLYAEVSYSPERPLDRKTIIPRIKSDLIKANILNKKDEIAVEDVNDIVYGYPIYDRCYVSARKELFDFLSKNHIVSCGRYGSWRYMSMEDSFSEGKQVAGLFHRR
jgi:protoporphyrinogen oxidase